MVDRKNCNKGFTVLELLIVVAVVGILSTVLLNGVSVARGKAINTKVKSQLGSLRTVQVDYGLSNSDLKQICNDDQLKKILINSYKATNASYTKSQCASTKEQWMSFASLTPDKYWCVDSSGNSIQLESEPYIIPGYLNCIDAQDQNTPPSVSIDEMFQGAQDPQLAYDLSQNRTFVLPNDQPDYAFNVFTSEVRDQLDPSKQAILDDMVANSGPFTFTIMNQPSTGVISVGGNNNGDMLFTFNAVGECQGCQDNIDIEICNAISCLVFNYGFHISES